MQGRYARAVAIGTMLGALCTAGSAGAQDELAAAQKLALNHCGVCHTFAAGEPVRQGPNLHGVVGRGAGTVEGFAYSAGFRKGLAGKTWDAALLDRWLADPQAVAPGTVMLYKQDDPDNRALLVRFLESLQ
jgi:cytochrome c